MPAFTRTCQACDYKLQCAPPSKDKELTAAYRNRACPKCKSECFDYGSVQLTAGDVSIISNLRRDYGDKLKAYQDEDIAQAWVEFSNSDEYERRNAEPDLFIDWVKMEAREV